MRCSASCRTWHIRGRGEEQVYIHTRAYVHTYMHARTHTLLVSLRFKGVVKESSHNLGSCACVSERHLSVVYVEDTKPEDAEVTQIREASYQLVDLRPEVLLTDTNWQACSTQPTKPCSTCATKPVIV